MCEMRATTSTTTGARLSFSFSACSLVLEPIILVNQNPTLQLAYQIFTERGDNRNISDNLAFVMLSGLGLMSKKRFSVAFCS